ncbi:MAG: hypothetical protein D6738_08465 [Acidobacteria bacterium]|nr:MAG: hypothetical protein D6738_08465 [Acidobacteriota bacterium]
MPDAPVPRTCRGSRGVPLAAAVLVAAVGWPAWAADRTVPVAEHQRVHRVQVSASVIDPSERRPVRGLPRDAFRLRLDGAPLPPGIAERTEFDEVCPADGDAADAVAPPVARIVVLADMRYLDLAMRHRTASAIREFADRLARAKVPVAVRVLAFGPRLADLTGGFTAQPEALRAAADRLEQELHPLAPPDGKDTLMAQRPARPPVIRGEGVRTGTRPPAWSGSEVALEESREGAALEIRTIDEVLEQGTSLLPSIGRSPIDRLARSDVDPLPSLAALEAVLASHAHLRGRKALVLFTGRRFDLPDALWLDYLEETRIAAQGGFALFTVDAGGFAAPPGSTESGILDYLALTTGGASLHGAGRLAIAFDRALDYLSCYYLFSIPLPVPERGRQVRHIDVSLDTRRYPETWRYRVRAAGTVTLVDAGERRRRRRLAAFLEPRNHRVPEVRIAASYPEGRRRTTRIGIAVLLSDLTFVDAAEGGVEAALVLEGMVVAEDGSPVCRLGSGRRHVIRAASPPSEHPPSLLVLRARCDLRSAGTFRVLAAVDDLLGDAVGSAAIALRVARDGRPRLRVSALRLGRNSGRDFVVDLGVADGSTVRRDRRRAAFVPLRAGDVLAPTDRLYVRFVMCGPPPPPWVIGYRRDGGERVDPAFQVLVGPAGAATAQAACREYVGTVPENSLGPGSYGIALVDRRSGASNRDDLDALLEAGRTLARVEFTVGEPPAAPPEPGREEQTTVARTAPGGLPG